MTPAEIITATRDPLAPAWYMTVAVALGLAAMAIVRETAPGRRGGSSFPTSPSVGTAMDAA